MTFSMKIQTTWAAPFNLSLGVAAIMLVACSTTMMPNTVTPESITPTKVNVSVGVEQHQLEPTYAAMIAAQRDPRIPDLPFLDNPDPGQCGIPIKWGTNDPAWLTGVYEGELIQSDIMLYESHLRLQINGEAPHGSEVTILMFQDNPYTDYYLVETKDAEAPIQGWVPEQLLSFERVGPLDAS